MPPRPHHNCYWLIPNGLLAGAYPAEPDNDSARARLARIARAGVRHFIDLTEPDELQPYNAMLPALSRGLDRPLVHERWPIVDMGLPRSPDYTNRILDRIDDLLAIKAMPYVHCWGGVGRTGTIAGCWLVRQGHSGERALQIIAAHWALIGTDKRKRHPRSPETDAQHRFVREWAAYDRVRRAQTVPG